MANKIPTANIQKYQPEDANEILRKENEELQKKLKDAVEASVYFASFIKRITTNDFDSPLHLIDSALMYASMNKMFVVECDAYLDKHRIPSGPMADFAGSLSNDNSEYRFESEELSYLNYIAHTKQYDLNREIFVPIFLVYAIHNPDIKIVCSFIKKDEVIDISELFV